MYEIENDYIIENNKAIITKETYTILEYDGYDILYFGYNDENDLIIGSFSDIDRENDIYTERYINIIITENELRSYFNKEISYRELINQSKDVYVVDRDGNKIIQTYLVPSSLIPEEVLPSYDTFYEEKETDHVYNLGEILR